MLREAKQCRGDFGRAHERQTLESWKVKLKRIYLSDQKSQVLLDITPQLAGWKYISFKVLRLAEGETIEADSATNEIVIVPLAGRGRVSFAGNSHVLVRDDLFRELADIVYLPPASPIGWKPWEPLSLQLAVHQPREDFQRALFAKTR